MKNKYLKPSITVEAILTEDVLWNSESDNTEDSVKNVQRNMLSEVLNGDLFKD